MASQNALKDGNSVSSTIFENASVAGETRRGQIDEATGRILVDSTSGVVGPVSSTDNAIARWDGTTGLTIQNSAVTVADTTGVIGVAGKSYTWPGQSGTFSTVTAGSGAPGTTPAALGQIYIDTGGPDVYMSTGTSSSADWTKIFDTP